jgi:hypothetical protein
MRTSIHGLSLHVQQALGRAPCDSTALHLDHIGMSGPKALENGDARLAGCFGDSTGSDGVKVEMGAIESNSSTN